MAAAAGAADVLVAAVATARQDPMGTLVELKGIAYVELGRRMEFYLSRQPQPSERALREAAAAGRTANEIQAMIPRKHKVMQATIRDIQIADAYQRQGLFTALVRFLLERDGAVHLEAVQPPWLKRRLAASPLWVCQSIGEGKADPGDEFNPCYARFEMNEPFTLF
jgi:hypothetical protein